MRLSVRLGPSITRSPVVSRATHGAPDGAKGAPLCQPGNCVSEQLDSAVARAVKKKRKLSLEPHVAYTGSVALPPSAGPSAGILTRFPFGHCGALAPRNGGTPPFSIPFGISLGPTHPPTNTVLVEPLSTSANKARCLSSRYYVQDLHYSHLQPPSQGSLPW